MNRLILITPLLLAAVLVLLAMSMAAPSCSAQANPSELGTVSWIRDLKKGLALAKAKNKDVFLLFQEVPGWKGCKDFGTQVLSDPQIVDAIETHYVPVCIYNNIKGKDAQVLAQFKEDSWNYPVTRIVDHFGKDLVARNANWRNRKGVIQQLVAGLRARNKATPAYLALLALNDSARNNKYETAVFGVSWYWVGEAEFGLKKGILSTRPGWLGNIEVVEVKFDPRVTTYADLAKHAAKKECAQPIFASNEAQLATARKYSTEVKKRGKGKIRWVKDNKYYLSQGALKYLPVTKTQATRINADLGNANHWLSPSQRALLKKIKANPKAPWPNAVGKPFARAWQAAMKVK